MKGLRSVSNYAFVGFGRINGLQVPVYPVFVATVFFLYLYHILFTLRKTNIVPVRKPSRKSNHPTINFQLLLLLVSTRALVLRVWWCNTEQLMFSWIQVVSCPYLPWYVYIYIYIYTPTFGWFLWYMQVNIFTRNGWYGMLKFVPDLNVRKYLVFCFFLWGADCYLDVSVHTAKFYRWEFLTFYIGTSTWFFGG